MMTDQEVTAHLRKAHGLQPGEVYDPYTHDEVPALAFGPVPSSDTTTTAKEGSTNNA